VLFAHVIGTPTVLDINHQCTLPANHAERMTYGDRILWDIGPDYQKSKCILIWGANPRHNRPAAMRDINMARSKGAKVIWIDPRPPEQVDRLNLGLPAADLWLRVRPGTDAALALAMIHIIIAEGLYNKRFVERWCVGFEGLKAHVKKYTPERTAEITWIPREQILEAARLFAKTRPSCIHTRLGTGSQQVNATQTVRAISILLSIVGDIDIPGGNLLNDPLGGFKTPNDIALMLRPSREVEARRIGAQEFPFLSGPREYSKFAFPQAHMPSSIRAMLQGKIKGLYVPGSNFVVMEGNSRMVWAALNQLDFLVVADFFLTPTAELADLVLPAAHWLETEAPMRAYQVMGPRRYNHILASKKVLEPRGECWDDRKMIIELAKRMKGSFPWQGVEDVNDWQLETVGVKFKEIQKKPNQMLSFPIRYKKYEERGFATPSGKVELRSSILERMEYPPFPDFEEPPQSPMRTPELFAQYPMILTQHRNIIYMHSEFRQVPSYRKEQPDPIIEVNPQTATKLGIQNGDWMWIERPGFQERVRGRARWVEGLHPQVVSMLVGWWFPEKPSPDHGAFESNINTIISNAPPYDPINGNHQARALLCRVGKE
jgi:anaerobic selenocysteine-containing dehydrogenase